jgi:hypothetical protein
MTMPLDQAPTSLVAMVLLATGTSALPPHEWGGAPLHSILRSLDGIV